MPTIKSTRGILSSLTQGNKKQEIFIPSAMDDEPSPAIYLPTDEPPDPKKQLEVTAVILQVQLKLLIKELGKPVYADTESLKAKDIIAIGVKDGGVLRCLEAELKQLGRAVSEFQAAGGTELSVNNFKAKVDEIAEEMNTVIGNALDLESSNLYGSESRNAMISLLEKQPEIKEKLEKTITTDLLGKPGVPVLESFEDRSQQTSTPTPPGLSK